MAKNVKPREKVDVNDIEKYEDLPKEEKIKTKKPVKTTNFNPETENFLRANGLIK